MKIEKNKLKKYIVIVSISVLVIALSIMVYLFYQLKIESKVLLLPENNFYVLEEGETKDKLAMKWVKGYFEQYMQEGINKNKKVLNIEFKSAELLEDENVRIDFELKIAKKQSNMFGDFGIINDNKVLCQWVIKLETFFNSNIQKNISFISRRSLPAGYDLEQYNISGQGEIDTETSMFLSKKEYEDKEKECTYKIVDGSLYLTYDKSQSWVKVQDDISKSIIKADTYKMEDAHFKVDKDLTYIHFKNMIITSEDQAKTWKIITCDKLPGGITYTYAASSTTAYVVVSADYAMGKYMPVIYKTDNAGESWNIINKSIGDLRKNSVFVAFNENRVFLLDPSVNVENSKLYISIDGFKTFKPVELPEGKFIRNLGNDELKWEKIYDTPEMPKLKYGALILVVGQGSDGDYEGGSKAAYKSNDMGITWEFIEEFKPAPEPWEG